MISLNKNINDIKNLALLPKFSMKFIFEILEFLKVRKKLWLAPLIFIMIILGGLLIIAEGSVVAPFIYTLF